MIDVAAVRDNRAPAPRMASEDTAMRSAGLTLTLRQGQLRPLATDRRRLALARPVVMACSPKSNACTRVRGGLKDAKDGARWNALHCASTKR